MSGNPDDFTEEEVKELVDRLKDALAEEGSQ